MDNSVVLLLASARVLLFAHAHGLQWIIQLLIQLFFNGSSIDNTMAKWPYGYMVIFYSNIDVLLFII
jgi:hypothetical protein